MAFFFSFIIGVDDDDYNSDRSSGRLPLGKYHEV